MPADAGGMTPRLHGVLVIDKPAGWTSHDVVTRARRLLGERRIGHAGTLDPAATGVLPLAVGDATRVLEYLTDASKTYLAEVTFGVETDSFDADGVVTAVADPASLDADRLERALAAFQGEIAQVPPMHAAIKIGGRRLYELARRGEEVERPSRVVTISTLSLVEWSPPIATLLVDCSKGTYVRALASNLGTALDVGAHLSNLVRLRTGPFRLCHAVTLTELADAPLPWIWPHLAFHPDAVLGDWPALLFDSEAAATWGHGGRVPADGVAHGPCRAYDEAGTWLGVGLADLEAASWRPTKVVGSAA